MTNDTPTTKSPALAVVTAALAFVLAASPAGAVCGDVSGDGSITAGDAQRVLRAAVGQDVELLCTDDCAVLEERIAALEALLANLTVSGDNLVLTGMNFQIVSGAGKTDAATNGKGNLIVGYNEAQGGDSRTGSHNVVVGRNHTYQGYGGIVAGENNAITGDSASVLGGTQNQADGDGSVVVGGQSNRTNGQSAVVVAGENNRANARSCSVATGSSNICSGFASAVSGGGNNSCTAVNSVVGGTTNRTLNASGGWMAGTLTLF